MNIGSWFTPAKPARQYDSHEALFLGLQKLETPAIIMLQTKALPMVRQVVKAHGLSEAEAEDILNKSTSFFFKRLQRAPICFRDTPLLPTSSK